MVKTFRTLGVALGCLVILNFSGCRSKPKTELNLIVWIQPEEKAFFEKQLQEFSRRNESLKVNLVICADEEECISLLRNRPNEASQPDVCMVSSKSIPFLIQEGLVKNVETQNPNLSAFIPETTVPFIFQKKPYAIPASWSILTLYFNRTLFEKQGVPFPKQSWEWSDLLQGAKLLTLQTEGQDTPSQYGLEITSNPEYWIPFLWQNRGEVMNENNVWSLIDPQFSQSNQEALDFYSALIREHHISPLISETKSSNRLFLSGKAAMTFGHDDLAKKLKKTNINWDITSLPLKRQPATLLEIHGYAISSRSRQEADAWKLISFLVHEVRQTSTLQTYGTPPSLKSLLDSKLFLTPSYPSKINRSVLLKTMTYSKPLPRIGEWEKASKIFSEEMARLMSDPEITPRSTLEAMQARLEELLLLGKDIKKTSQSLKFSTPTQRPDKPK